MVNRTINMPKASGLVNVIMGLMTAAAAVTGTGCVKEDSYDIIIMEKPGGIIMYYQEDGDIWIGQNPGEGTYIRYREMNDVSGYQDGKDILLQTGPLKDLEREIELRKLRKSV